MTHPVSAAHGPEAPDPRFSAPMVRAAYDAVADDYTAAFADDLDRLPLDRAMLDEVVARVTPGGLVLDLGCGPAPVSRYLSSPSVRAVGIDLAPRMLAAARSRNPALALAGADMRQLPFPADTFAAVVACYSIQHLSRADLPLTLAEIARVVISNGVLLLATHLGHGDVYIDEFLGHHIQPVGGALYERDHLVATLDEADFAVEVEQHRGPLPHEADTVRIYLLAHSRLRDRPCWRSH